jgi:hypothetical protein
MQTFRGQQTERSYSNPQIFHIHQDMQWANSSMEIGGEGGGWQ